MTHTNSLVCSETVTEKWRVWVGCGKCVSGPEQYVKTCVLKCLLQSSQQPPSRSVALCWTPDTGAYRLSPGACQSATLHYTAAFVADDQKRNVTMRERGVKPDVRKCVHVCYDRRRAFTCVHESLSCTFWPSCKAVSFENGWSLWSKGPINPSVSPVPIPVCQLFILALHVYSLQ